MGWSGITISSDGKEIVKDLRGNTKMTQIGERGAESRLYLHKILPILLLPIGIVEVAASSVSYDG